MSLVFLVLFCLYSLVSSEYKLNDISYNSYGFPSYVAANILSDSPDGKDPTERSHKRLKDVGLDSQKYDVGHIIANRFGGQADYVDGKAVIWFAQNNTINRGTYRMWEMKISDLLTQYPGNYADVVWQFYFDLPVCPKDYYVDYKITDGKNVVYSDHQYFLNYVDAP